jgi:hypothetical protein
MSAIEKLIPYLPGHEVVQQGGAKLVQEIRNLISAPFKIYQETYEKTLWHLAEICQSMPYDENGSPYSLLQRQLNICIASLKLKHGKLLPENAEPENMAKEEAQYSYAIFMAALLYGLDKIQHDRKILFYNSRKENCGQWSPLTVETTQHRLVSTGSWFDVQWTPCITSEILPCSAFNGIIAMNIIPPKIMQWMSENCKLVPLWWNAMTGNPSGKENNPISDIIQQAVVFIDNKDKPSQQSTQNIGDFNQKKEAKEEKIEISEDKKNPENLLKALLDFIETKQNQNQNQDKDQIIRISIGLLVSKNILQEFAASIHEKSVDTLLEQINLYLKGKNHHYYFKYRHKNFESRKFLEGVVIDKKYLNDRCKQLSISDEYQPNIA